MSPPPENSVKEKPLLLFCSLMIFAPLVFGDKKDREPPPVFHYGSTREDITDPSMTFEELRIAKSEDFPELAVGKKVSWTVEYGKTIKVIIDPKGTVIARPQPKGSRSRSLWGQ